MRVFMRVLMIMIMHVVAAALLSPTALGQTPNAEHVLDDKGRPLQDSRYDVIRALEEEEQVGLDLYRGEQYQQAYARLSLPASRGLKASQHAIALMHLKGQSVAANILVGTALFGLAAESGDKKLEKEYQKLLKQVPDKYRSLVVEQTAYYIARYGRSAQGIDCAKTKKPGSNFSTMTCLKQPGDYQEHEWAP
jgi:uncharacterized protein YecT (DUF1311 family)